MFIKDKNKLINVDKIFQIYIDEYIFGDSEPLYYIRYFGSAKESNFSTRFSSLENAEKCLNEIVSAIANNFAIIDLEDICYSIKKENTQNTLEHQKNTSRCSG